MGDTLLPRGANYEDVYARFRWTVPPAYNIAVDVCDRHAVDRSRVALVHEDDAARSNQLARALAGLGIERGDRVAIVLPQRPETAVAHLAAYKLGAIAVPLSTLFGPEALEYRLRDAGAKVVVTDSESLERVVAVAKGLPALARVISVDPADADGVLEYAKALANVPDSLEPVSTAAEDPALLIYTSGTTGPPKGALHAHRVVLGHLPAIEFYHEYFPQPGDRHWSPADWAWAGGLLDVLLPSWHYGVTVVAHRPKKFDAERAFEVLARHRVRNTFLVPTMLKMMRSVTDPRGRWPLVLRSMRRSARRSSAGRARPSA
jgi:acetyl-CoA synthetase